MNSIWVEAGGNMENMYSYNHTPSFLARSTFFYVQSFGHFFCDDEYYTKREGYKSFLLIYTLDGKGYAEYRGIKYELSKGQVLIMDCFDYHEYRTDPVELWDMKWIHFNGASSEQYFNMIYEKYGPVIDMGGKECVLNYIDQILSMHASGDRQFEIKASSIIVRMLTDILLTTSGKASELKIKKNNCDLQKIYDLIEKKYDSNISLDDMAASVNLSKYYFLRIFKEATCYSPYEYLVKYRINRAKSLLESTDKPIEQIAVDVGFESTSNFIRTFKKIESMTPLKYRKYWNG